jgi:hypothetical protein
VLGQVRLRNDATDCLSEGCDEVVPLLTHRLKIGADHTEALYSLLGTKATGDLLLDLGHAHGLLGDIIGERNLRITGKSPYSASYDRACLKAHEPDSLVLRCREEHRSARGSPRYARALNTRSR